MTNSIEVVGKTEEEAIALALSQLNLDRDDVSVEVLERHKPGFLGLGGNPARIKVTYEVKTRLDDVKRFVEGLVSLMGTKAEVTAEENEDGNIKVDLKGEGLGMIIGRRGETLDAIQSLTNYSINRETEKRIRVTIDAESYRQKREKALQKLAVKVAARVAKYRKSITLEPMNSYERHVIHSALQDFADVTTHSSGNEPNRRVVISYCRDKKENISDDDLK